MGGMIGQNAVGQMPPNLQNYMGGPSYAGKTQGTADRQGQPYAPYAGIRQYGMGMGMNPMFAMSPYSAGGYGGFMNWRPPVFGGGMGGGMGGPMRGSWPGYGMGGLPGRFGGANFGGNPYGGYFGGSMYGNQGFARGNMYGPGSYSSPGAMQYGATGRRSLPFQPNPGMQLEQPGPETYIPA